MNGLAEWPLVVAVLAALMAGAGVLVAALTLGHRIVTQLLGRVDAVTRDLTATIELRFAEAEARRAGAGDLWVERLRARDAAIAQVAADLARAEARHPALQVKIEKIEGDLVENYVHRTIWMAHVAGVNIKLDKLKEDLDRLAARLPTQDRNHESS